MRVLKTYPKGCAGEVRLQPADCLKIEGNDERLISKWELGSLTSILDLEGNERNDSRYEFRRTHHMTEEDAAILVFNATQGL